MKALTADQIRRTFLDYFKSQGHTEVASSALVPQNDPTLLFTNAGMVQFKDVFTGKEKRDYKRATTSQKCVRAGGKHNDLESVGVTPRHHTFFEMLGNFSFGDYFKEDAIKYAFELTTKVYGLPLERLAVTVFEGADGIPADVEAEELWRAAGVPKERIIRLGKKDNYWQMGDTGPQGPCSEIHYFMGDDVSDMLAPGRVEHSIGWLEIWNCVFMQFVRETADGPLDKLPAPSVDTGAGLERFAMVLQGKKSNYATDLFMPLLEGIAADIGKAYRGSEQPDDISMRVIADHSRATAFLVADGVMPSNEGRGYVLRRIMRRAIRHGQKLGFDDLFFHRACERVIARMEEQYPDLRRAAPSILKVAENEEAMFRRTLDRGLKLLNNEFERARGKRTALEPGFVAELYDTYGFPIDLTRVIAAEHGFAVDEEAAQGSVKERQSKGNVDKPGGITSDKAIDKQWFALRDEVGATEFTGYAEDASDAAVRAIVKKDGGTTASAKVGDEVIVLLDRTPFYAESGGQVGDLGELTWPGGKMMVMDTQKPLPELHAHVGQILEGELAQGATVRATVRNELRDATRKNHSATHLLHLALREVLGAHVQQKGSLVAPDRLRFDYAHFEPLTAEQAEKIENRVNALVLANAATETVLGSIDEAKKHGAMMLFGEKYGDKVRMVRIGAESLELCGGTHVHRAGDIGLFKITSDAAIASGVRRMEAVTGMNALALVQKQERLLKTVAGALRASPEEAPDRLDKLVKKVRDLEKDLEKARAEAAMGGGGGDPTARAEDIQGVRVLVHRADGTPRGALRELADRLRDKLGSGVVILGAVEEDKASLLVAVTKDLAGSKVRAGDLVKAAAAAMGGSGGGKPDFAQGGGPAAKLDEGLAAAKAAVAKS
ncbi:alanine--tRNA ligase [Myxococcota bacterium]|nr:alanine--tRNA ligase [Myxococcota bacterium]